MAGRNPDQKALLFRLSVSLLLTDALAGGAGHRTADVAPDPVLSLRLMVLLSLPGAQEQRRISRPCSSSRWSAIFRAASTIV